MTEEPRFTPEGDYATFLNGLAGLIDDADMAGYDPAAVELLAEARERFWQEFFRRHPERRPEPKK